MSRLLPLLLPGLIFQSVVVGGGYATGRELVEFFLPAGPVGGLLGMLITMLIWSAVLAASLELARASGATDYRSFFRLLLGRAWWVFELAYVLLLILVLSVLGAASGEMGQALFGWPAWQGSLLLLGAISLVLGAGNAALQRTLGGFALALYAVFIVFLLWTASRFGQQMLSALQAPVQGGWLSAGLRYAGYNLVVIPAILFCASRLRSRREALIAGALGGPLAMLPGLFFYLALMAFHDELSSVALPSTLILQRLEAGAFLYLFQLVVFATLVATGAGLIHALNERLQASLQERGRQFSPAARRLSSLLLMGFAIFGAGSVGLIGLIAQGYGLLTWVFIAVFAVPVLTIGPWRLSTLRSR